MKKKVILWIGVLISGFISICLASVMNMIFSELDGAFGWVAGGGSCMLVTYHAWSSIIDDNFNGKFAKMLIYICFFTTVVYTMVNSIFLAIQGLIGHIIDDILISYYVSLIIGIVGIIINYISLYLIYIFVGEKFTIKEESTIENQY